MPFDPGWTVGEDPARNKIVLLRHAVKGTLVEDRLPGIAVLRGERRSRICGGQVLANRMPLVPVHASLSLLQVNRVRGQVPMHHRMTVEVEVQPLLSH